ncbi:hypothetical protein HYH03_014470 [Edaphochlamys debaryana]|uniref:Uncharacterized protein n=1 Tax=Edaphochlamys debaryana TaxID=47281 RepID=A0A835XRF2_9CHLO|nr:hypothetical protein HYH03_014470 [Edaphochlamys debaryana]|eukprot:KAG2486876.1 hypothetical protein HYH03_014470 [Edaphochlamys debaryana]
MAAPMSAVASPIATQTVEVPTAGLEQVLYRLQEKRIALEKVVLQYGEAPAGIKEVFELCRGFERAYTSYVNESPVASKIKEAFMGEAGLAGKIKKLPMDKVFELKNVKSVCRQSDGYQPSMVAPEKGLRQLGNDALDQIVDPVNLCVQEVYNLLVNAGREAAEKAGQFTEAALMGAMPMYVPDFKNVVMPAIVAALDEWKKDSEKMAHMLVDMERSYITAGFFRHTTYHRYHRIKQQEQMRAAMAAKGLSGEQPKGTVAAVKQTAAKFFPSFGNTSGPATMQPAQMPPPGGSPGQSPNGAAVNDDDSDDGKSPAKPIGPGPNVTNADDFIAGYFDKYVSDDSARFLEAMKWQRRFFVFSESQRVLYYFKSPEDVSKPTGLRGQVNIAECIVEDLDDKGNPRTAAGVQNVATLDKNQLMIRIRHRDPRGVAVKDHNAIIMRAENLDTKLLWLGKLRKAAEPRKAAPAAAGAAGAAPAGGTAGVAGTAAGGAAGVPNSGPSTSGPSAVATAGTPASASGTTGYSGFSGFGGGLDDGDLSWAKEAEPHLDTHLGEGSSAFRADNARDSEGRLLPAPQQLLNPLRLKERQAKAAASASPWDVRYDALLDQFSSDMQLYMGCVHDTVIITVPKAVVHCMIRKSEKNLLERLFTVIHHLTPTQLANLLKEDEPIIEKRKLARVALEDVKTAIFQLQQVLERQNMAAPHDRKDKVPLQCMVFAYAGIREPLSAEQYKYFDARFNDKYAPECVRFNWFIRPQGMPTGGISQGPAGPPLGAPPSAAPQRPPGAPVGPPASASMPRPAPGPPGAAPMASGPSMSGLQRPPGVPAPQRPAPGAPMGQPMAAQRRAPPPPPGR